MGIYLSYILYGDFSHTFCMGISLIHFVWDSTFFLLKSGPSSGTGKAPIAEGRALLEVEVLEVSPAPSPCCFNLLFTGIVRVGVKIPQDGNRANRYRHVAMVHEHVWRTVCSVCATGARVAQPVPCNS